MTPIRKVCLASLAFMSTLAGQVEADNLIFNGSFESGNYDTPGFVRVFPGENRITGWQVGGMAVDWHVASENPNANPYFTGAHFGPANDGSLVMDLNLDGLGTGTIQQSFQTMPNHTYHVSFQMAASNWFTVPRAVRVDVITADGQTLASQTIYALGSNQYDMQWERFGFSFLSQPYYGTTTLKFSSPDESGFWGPLLDDVQVHASDTSRPFVESSFATTSPQGLHNIQLNFSERLDPMRGFEFERNYRIVSAGPDRKYETADDVSYSIRRVQNDQRSRSTSSVMIEPDGVVPLTHPVRFTALRTGIYDLYGNSMAADFIREFRNGPRPPRTGGPGQ